MGEHGKYRALVGPLAGLAVGLGPGAAEAACRLALLVALDISSSVDPIEDRLQRQGLARALVAEEVQRAILALPGEPMALAIYEWSGRYQQDTLLGWTLLESRADIEAASTRIATSQRSYADFPTAMGFALGHAATLFGAAPDCLFRTIDLSGDGINNDGFGPDLAYANFALDDVTVNGLAIQGSDDEVVAFYREHLQRGPGSFVEVADGFEDFEHAMTRKLVRELGVRVTGAAR